MTPRAPDDFLQAILQRLQGGTLSVEQALEQIRGSCERDIGFARIDTDRQRRRGLPEVVYAPGKTSEQIVDIVCTLRDAGQNVLVTRVLPGQFDAVRSAVPEIVYHRAARALTLDVAELPPRRGLVAVVCAGTSDIPVAEEARLTAERMGARVECVRDVGVAGLHRVIRHLVLFRKAHVTVVVAGMEGALPSVVAGLIDKPVIAVPTSIGYGAHFAGIAPLLAMLNTCVPGITVVNIDNGFGAGVAAAMINRTVLAAAAAERKAGHAHPED